jgi:hypothetical protein
MIGIRITIVFSHIVQLYTTEMRLCIAVAEAGSCSALTNIFLLHSSNLCGCDRQNEDNKFSTVQNYLASFGLCPSSGIWKFYKRPQRFGDWICLHPQVDG